VHGVRTPVRRIGASLDQTLPLELLDEVDHRRFVGVHDLDELPLAQIAAFGQQPENGDVGDVQVERAALTAGGTGR
jgi:hypothetical protein